MDKTKETVRKIICLEYPDGLIIRNVFSGTEPKNGEIVSVFFGREFLGYGKIMNARRDAKLYGFRHDVVILE